jgi:ribosome recycling factor
MENNNWENTKIKNKLLFDENLKNLIINLEKVRSGRVSLDLIKSIQVKDSLGNKTFVRNISSLRLISSSEFVVSSFDPKDINNIKKAILDKSLGYNLSRSERNDAYFSLSPMTGEIRKSLLDEIKTITEKSKIGLRRIKQDIKNSVKNDKSIVSQDYKKRCEKELDILVKDYSERIEELERRKIKEIEI